MKSAEVLGDMALSSYQTALQILHDKAVIKTLLSLLMVKHAGILCLLEILLKGENKSDYTFLF